MIEKIKTEIVSPPEEHVKFLEYINSLYNAAIKVRVVNHFDDEGNIVNYYGFYEYERKI